MNKEIFYTKTGCRCILKLQAPEELENGRCRRCRAATEEKEKYDASKQTDNRE